MCRVLLHVYAFLNTFSKLQMVGMKTNQLSLAFFLTVAEQFVAQLVPHLLPVRCFSPQIQDQGFQLKQ